MPYSNHLDHNSCENCTNTCDNNDRCDNVDYCKVCEEASHHDYYCYGDSCFQCSHYYSCNQTEEYTDTYSYADNYSYNNHANYSIAYPPSFELEGISKTSTNAWTNLSSAIPDIKKLRDEIKRITTKYGTQKGIAANGSLTSGKGPIQWETATTENAETEFGYGKMARAAQINETINNVETLWQAIKGGSSGLPSLKNKGDPRSKADYKTIIEKASELAKIDQTPATGYLNHLNENKYPNYHSSTKNNIPASDTKPNRPTWKK
ncbi:hypothetical protein NO1_0673 [Candidatus Termititenax aidoneus]|uniref:Uncharacterized protein n=1 Tax=Termititenax aidoneus TaxID=2218524 RepID=A0A388T9F0_TERA1|nr:hypothetical protein NO1_0673 [Candidatus Termititenax aidoneus]